MIYIIVYHGDVCLMYVDVLKKVGERMGFNHQTLGLNQQIS